MRGPATARGSTAGLVAAVNRRMLRRAGRGVIELPLATVLDAAPDDSRAAQTDRPRAVQKRAGQVTVSVVNMSGCGSQKATYVPGRSWTLQIVRPVPGTLVFLATPCPKMWKLWIVLRSLTTSL